MPFLTPHLPFSNSPSASLPPPGSHLLITDSVQAPGDFAVVHCLFAAIKEGRKVILIDLPPKSLPHYTSLSRKLSIPLPPVSSGLFTLITPSSLPSSSPSSLNPALFDEEDEPTLIPLWEAVASLMLQQGENEGGVVVIDGLEVLLELGFPIPKISRFIRALLALARNTQSTLITHLHSPPSPQHTNLLERLLRLGGGWWRIERLESGRSAVVMGEISAHPLPPTPKAAFPYIPRAQPVQYRVLENGVEVFAKGTGRGFL